MAVTEIFVDPSIAGDSGNGLIGTPYGDLEYAIEQETFDTTNGTRVNIKAGTAEILAAQLDTALADTSVSVAWTPSETAQLIFQGYSASAADGGQGEIDGNAASVINTGRDFIHFIDLKLGNTGANVIAQLDDYSSFIRCESHTGTGSGLEVGINGQIISCYMHHDSANNRNCCSAGVGSFVAYNHVEPGSTNCTYPIFMGADTGTAYRNIIVLNGVGSATKYGIYSIGARVINNSIYSSGAHTGSGIYISINDFCKAVTNNLIEGFSGTGGRALGTSTNTSLMLFGGNAEYNCDIGFEAPTEQTIYNFGDNETLTVSPFTDAAIGDFTPIDAGNVKEGSLPQIIGGGLV